MTDLPCLTRQFNARKKRKKTAIEYLASQILSNINKKRANKKNQNIV